MIGANGVRRPKWGRLLTDSLTSGPMRHGSAATNNSGSLQWLTPVVRAPPFGDWGSPLRRSPSARLQELHAELIDLCVGPEAASSANWLSMVVSPSLAIRVGRSAAISIDPETDLFTLVETDRDGGILVLVMADGKLLIEHVMCYLAHKAATVMSFASRRAVSVLVGRSIEDVERHLVLETLHRCGGDSGRAAAMLGIPASAVREKLRAYWDVFEPEGRGV